LTSGTEAAIFERSRETGGKVLSARETPEPFEEIGPIGTTPLDAVSVCSPSFIPASALAAVRGPLVVRDAAGKSRRARLRPAVRGGEPGLEVRGPFAVLHRYRVDRDAGMRFCRATGDDNPIHFQGDVVPGALTASKAILAIEVLFPDLDIASIAIKFLGMQVYGTPAELRLRLRPIPLGLRVDAVARAGDMPLAQADVLAVTRQALPPPKEVVRRKVNVDRLKGVRDYFAALGVASHAYFRRYGDGGYYYPKAYLASLPSGAMVRQLRGEGGLLNRLTLEFDPSATMPITGSDGPEVSLERPRARRTFNKILTAIGEGLKTYVRGSALVLARGANAAATAAAQAAPLPGVEAAPPEPNPA
jgi:hypothetical protein